jgi:poly-gamma-glutamate capsule biosynthesis protein CapA/YwtB (metallophosphatase superfamily)
MIAALFWSSITLASPADLDHEAGMTAQRAGDAKTALKSYETCLEKDPKHVPCHWEIGWSYWTLSDWENVVLHWNRVKALAPDHPEVNEHLPTALGHLESLQLIRAGAEHAPKTVRTQAPEDWSLRIRAVGDIMMGTDFPHPTAYLPPDDGLRIFSGVETQLRDADLTFGNLEGPLCDGGATTKCAEGANCYAFRTPTRYVRHLVNAGFDMVSTANNHAEDFGATCRTQTEDTLRTNGIAFSGRPGTVASQTIQGRQIALIGFHTSRNSHYVNDHETARALVEGLSLSHDLVIVSFHGGAEGNKALHVPKGRESFYGENRGDLRTFTRILIEAGADVIFGHGPHVPRGLELIDGHLVAYSLGNFATYGRFGLGGHLSTSLILEVVLDGEGRLVQGQILPISLQGKGIPETDASGTAIDLIRSLSTEDFGASAPLIGQDGSFAPKAQEP